MTDVYVHVLMHLPHTVWEIVNFTKKNRFKWHFVEFP
jgi:hypothetical protein